MTSKRALYAVAALVGIALVLLAAFVITWDILSGLCFGVGGAMTALAIGNLIYSIAVPQGKQDSLAREKEIEVHDERNIAIKEKASTRTSQVMTYLLCALILVLGALRTDIIVLACLGALLPIKAVLYTVFFHNFSKQL